MPQRSTLFHVANLVIDQVLAEVDNNSDLCEALNRAYPFSDEPEGREVWLEALLRNAFDIKLLNIPEASPAPRSSEQSKSISTSTGG